MAAPHLPRIGGDQVLHTPGEKYRCYLPSPLPPGPAVQLEALMATLERAGWAVGGLIGIGAILPNPELFL